MAAAPPGAPSADGKAGDGFPVITSRAELLRRWEDLFDEDEDLAKKLFFDALLRDARAEYARRGRKENEEEERRRARVFEPWQPAAPGSALQPVVTAPWVTPTVVMGLRAPPHLARHHERTPSAPAAGRPPK